MPQNAAHCYAHLLTAEFSRAYGMQGPCAGADRLWRWPESFVRQHCAQAHHSEFRRGCRLYFKCTACRHQRGLVSDTIFESSKLPLSKLVSVYATLRIKLKTMPRRSTGRFTWDFRSRPFPLS